MKGIGIGIGIDIFFRKGIGIGIGIEFQFQKGIGIGIGIDQKEFVPYLVIEPSLMCQMKGRNV